MKAYYTYNRHAIMAVSVAPFIEKQGIRMNPHALEDLYNRLNRPVWFWPALMLVIFIVLPLLASAVEAAP